MQIIVWRVEHWSYTKKDGQHTEGGKLIYSPAGSPLEDGQRAFGYKFVESDRVDLATVRQFAGMKGAMLAECDLVPSTNYKGEQTWLLDNLHEVRPYEGAALRAVKAG